MSFHDLTGKSRSVYPNGYEVVYYPEHPNAYENGHVYYHRLLMENMLGRYLASNECVHHKDGNRQNNKKSNLELTSFSKHLAQHNRERSTNRVLFEDPVVKNCPTCEEDFETRRILQKFCSVKCAAGSRHSIKCPSKDDLQQLVYMFPLLHLATRFDISDNAIRKWCRKLGITLPNRAYWIKKNRESVDSERPSRKELKIHIWEQSIPKLTLRFGVKEGVIRRWCKEYGLATPPPGYWRKVETGNIYD